MSLPYVGHYFVYLLVDVVFITCTNRFVGGGERTVGSRVGDFYRGVYAVASVA